MKFLNREILPLDKDGSVNINLEKYNKRRQESERRMCFLFKNYRNAKKQISQFTILLVEEFPDFVHKWLGRNDITISHNRSQQRIDKKQGQQATRLSRCEFCYKFWLTERKRGNNEPVWHCSEDKCITLYGTWKKHLSRKGIELSRLYE